MALLFLARKHELKKKKRSPTVVSDNENVTIQDKNATSDCTQAVSLATTCLVVDELDSSKGRKHEKATLHCLNQEHLHLIIEQEQGSRSQGIYKNKLKPIITTLKLIYPSVALVKYSNYVVKFEDVFKALAEYYM